VPDYTLPPSLTLLAGMTGAGKTTFVNRYLVNDQSAACRFPGDTKAALRWWCRWVFHVSNRGPGKKMVVIPELWRHCNPDAIPVELALLAQSGRELDVELIVDTQRPEQVNASITGAATELVAFKLISSEALRAMERLWRDSGIPAVRETVSRLPLGAFIAWNRLSGGSLSGRVF
jgi:DNA helicase HerA-like ATPase